MEITSELLDLVLYGRLDRKMECLFNNNAPYKANYTMSVPKEVCVFPSTIPGAQLGVFSTTHIKQGTEMGPYTGTMTSQCPGTRNTCTPHAWEILNDEGIVIAYIEGHVQSTTNWLSHVQCARTDREQNLEVIQVGQQIFYRALKDIVRGEELLVWYGASYTMYMGLPYIVSALTHGTIAESDKECQKTESVETEQTEQTGSGKWNCVLCHRSFNSRSNLRSHMRIHTQEKPFTCKFCSRQFSQSSTLRNHVRLHTGEKPYKCSECRSSYSQLAGLRAHQRSSTHRPKLALKRQNKYVNIEKSQTAVDEV